MDLEEESASKEVKVESEEESDSGVASLALATDYVAKSIFNTEDNDFHTNAKADDKDDPPPTTSRRLVILILLRWILL